MGDECNTLKRRVDANDVRTDQLTKLAKMDPTTAIRVKFDSFRVASRIVHKDIICSQSEYFRRKLLPGPGELQCPREIDLRVKEINDVQFDIYLDWLYTRRSTSLDEAIALMAQKKADEPDKGCTSAKQLDHLQFHVLVDIWLVGERLEDKTFQDEIMRAIFRVPHELQILATTCKALRSVMFKTPNEGSKLRRLCLDLMECRITSNDVDDLEIKDWTKDIVVVLMKTLATKAPQGPVPSVEMYLEKGAAAAGGSN